MARQSKYQPLADYLSKFGENDVTFSFSQIEEMGRFI